MLERLKYCDKKTLWQLIRFGIVGVINTLITLAVIYLLQEVLDVKYTTANLAGYVAGVINSFFWSKLWVFKKLNSNFIREAVLFLISFGVCYGIQFVSLLVLVELLHIPDLWAQLLGMVVYTLCNFIMNRCITFKK
ncbi:MAG TPA: GtrA family protein [Candidatus Barnesiella excrementigallinarum]|nr:GtrA family protein [Candidatus Barnesiella excrementigallinarum]